jgi:hypothetical protein
MNNKIYTKVQNGTRESWKKFGNGTAIPTRGREIVIDMEKVQQLRNEANERWIEMHGEMQNPMPW